MSFGNYYGMSVGIDQVWCLIMAKPLGNTGSSAPCYYTTAITIITHQCCGNTHKHTGLILLGGFGRITYSARKYHSIVFNYFQNIW